MSALVHSARLSRRVLPTSCGNSGCPCEEVRAQVADDLRAIIKAVA